MTDPGALPEFHMLVELARVRSRDHQEVYIWRHPRLLEPGVAETLAVAAAGAPWTGRRALKRALDHIRAVRRRYESQPTGYAIGVGPIEEIWHQVSAGQISAAEGERLVTASSFTAALSTRYLRSLSGWAADRSRRGEWRPALKVFRLLYAAAHAADARVATVEVRAWIAIDWLDVAKSALHEAPDGRLMAEMRTIAQAALADLGRDASWELRSALLFGLGTLFLDPYFAHTSSPHREERLDAWQRRGALALDPVDDDEPTAMPEPLEALHTAEDYLRQALALKPPGYRAATEKALVDVLSWRKQLGDDVDVNEIIRLCRDALADLDHDGDDELRMSLFNQLVFLDVPIDAGLATAVLDRPLDDMIEEYGVERAVSLLLVAARNVLTSEPRRALDALRRSRPLLAMGNEDQRISAFDIELIALVGALTPGLAEHPTFADSLAAMTGRADREEWNGAARAAAMMRLANRSSDTDEEHLGLQLLDRLPETSPIVAAEHAELLALLRTQLELNMGVNAFNAKRWVDCAEWYARALSGFLDLGMDGRAFQTLLRVGDIMRRADTPVDTELVLALAPNAARIEARLGDGATTVIQDLVREAVASMSGRPINPVVVHLLWQIAKGARLAPVLASSRRYEPAEDRHAQRLLATLGELRAELSVAPGVVGTDPDVLLDEESVLTAYARRRETEGGATLEQQVANLERAFDEHITQQMLVAAGDQSSFYLGLDDVQARLGDRTVLLSMYLGATADGELAVYVLTMTSDEVTLSVIPHGFPSSRLMLGDLMSSPFALIVADARRDIQDPPLGRRLVSRAAERMLDSHLGGLLGHASERLADFKAAGRDHLCIVPHGPFHFFPFHLLGPPGHPLSEDFAVTYLPQLQLIARDQTGTAGPGRGTAIGLGFAADRRPGLVPLPEAIPEAREIARLFGRPAVVEERATEEATIAALLESSVVHIATHGRHNVDAPAFQTLYLQPTRGSDGRLHAHELLGLDLGQVRLLTLSACETALGRFDAGDNIRGLPASFFITGVSALVGTLWRVRDIVSHHFFAQFYQAYVGGTPMLDTFVHAQRQTRAEFPQYRDWGGFYFAGDWAEHNNGEEK